jgi:tripartite-type tricarboxylate transporter receptor subunit TctC
MRDHAALSIRMVSLAAVLSATVAAASPAVAQDWPTRLVTMVVPYAAGSASDVTARVLAPRLSELLGQQVVIDNAGGAGGMTGSARVAKAGPDFHQFVLGNAGTHAQNQTLYRHPLYNAATDFAPVVLIATSSFALFTRSDLPVRNLQEFIAYTKANQAKMQYGTAGAGSAMHFACLLLNAAIGVNVTHVPYRGSPAVSQDLIAGRIDYMCPVAQVAIPLVDGGTAKAIAALTTRRLALLPDVPSTREQGLGDFDVDGWWAFFMPKGTPAAIVRRLHDATVATMETPAVQERMRAIGADLVAPDRRSPEYLQSFVEREIARWAEPIRSAGLVLD